jgi:hypothetical protein
MPGADQLSLEIAETLGKHGVSMQGGVMENAAIFFLVLALIVCAVVIVGFLIDHRILKNKVLQALEASALNKITGGKSMPYSPFSTTTLITTGAAPLLAAPVLTAYSADANDPSYENTIWQLPATDNKGQPIQAMSEIQVYATKKGIIGAVADLFGLEPNAKVPVNPSMAGQAVTAKVGPLEFETDYEFHARLKE